MKVSPIGAGSSDQGSGDQLKYAGPPSPVDPDTGQTATWLIQILNDLRNGVITLWPSVTTAQRPTDPQLGQIEFNSTLGILEYCTAARIPGSPGTAAQWGPVAVVSTSVPFQTTVISATGAGTFTWPIVGGVQKTFAWVTMVAGGAGGSGTNNGAGGGGESAVSFPYIATGATESYTVGAGGAGGSSAGGANGGDTTFGTLTVHGGKGTIANPANGGAGGGVYGGGGGSGANGGNASAGSYALGGGGGSGGTVTVGGGSGIFLGASSTGTGGGGGASGLHAGTTGAGASGTLGAGGNANAGANPGGTGGNGQIQIVVL
jgi:hypothetical protein